MYDYLFIAEKSSVAETIAQARAKHLGEKAIKAGGLWRVGSDAVVWLAGHMFKQVDPAVYDPRWAQWNIGDLPMIPKKWRIEPIVEKERSNGGKAGRVKEINGLIKQSHKIVNVGDSAREGQLLVDELLEESGIDAFGSNVYRLWINDMTEPKIIAAMKAMFLNSEKQPLYHAALGRQRADWTLGMNMTRLYTGLARRAGMVDGVISVGRVQTPTLRIVVDRDREIEKFKAVDHYLPSGLFAHANGTFKANLVITPDHEGLDVENRMVDKAAADRIMAKIAGKSGKVESFETKQKKKEPPLPFNLAGLQKELSAKFGFTAARTLEIGQSLYDTYKVTSYPRTDSSHLPTGILAEDAGTIVGNLGRSQDYAEIVEKANLKLKSPAWNDSKVSDHYGIIPTTEATAGKIANLPPDERKVFDLIAKRFLAQFYPDYRWDSLSAVVGVEGERFKATGNNVRDKGWKAVYEKGAEKLDKDNDEDEDDQSLPSMVRGDAIKVQSSRVESKRTTPPSRLTDGTLIELMESVHRLVTDPEIKKRLKESSGIGTPATRAAILELLCHRKFLERKGKYIQSTKLGRDLIDMVATELSDPGLTALWEEQLERVANDNLSLDAFMGALNKDVNRLVETLRNTAVKLSAGATGRAKPLPGTGNPCPKCGKGHLVTVTFSAGKYKGKSLLKCDRNVKDDPNGCDHVDFSGFDKPIKPMDGHGTTCPVCKKGVMTTREIQKGDKKGMRFLVCSENRKDDPQACKHIVFDGPKAPAPLPGHGETCSVCHKGTMATRVVQKDGPRKGQRFLACNNSRKDDDTSCKNMVWPDDKLPGDGETCKVCNSGKMHTKTSTKEGPNKGRKYLGCSNWQSGCKNFSWGDAGPAPAASAQSTSQSKRPAGSSTRAVRAR